MTLGARALIVAAQEVGVREDPPGSNRGPRVDEYIRAAGLDPDRGSYPWCACFVSWAVRAASAGWAQPVAFRPSASCARMVKLNRSLLIDEPEVGCVFVHLRPDGKGHTGFVVQLLDDGRLHTLEGNTDSAGSRTGGEVRHQVRERAYVTHYLRVA